MTAAVHAGRSTTSRRAAWWWAFVASLPDAAVLVAAWMRRARWAPSPERPLPGGLAVLASRDGEGGPHS